MFQKHIHRARYSILLRIPKVKQLEFDKSSFTHEGRRGDMWLGKREWLSIFIAHLLQLVDIVTLLTYT